MNRTRKIALGLGILTVLVVTFTITVAMQKPSPTAAPPVSSMPAPSAATSTPTTSGITTRAGLTFKLGKCSRMEPAGSRDDLFVNVTCEKADHPWSDIRVYEPDARIGSLKCEHDPNITQEVQMTSLGTRMVGGIKADYAEAYPCEGDTTERFLSWVVALPNGKRVTIEATKTGSMDPTRFVESATWVAT